MSAGNAVAVKLHRAKRARNQDGTVILKPQAPAMRLMEKGGLFYREMPVENGQPGTLVLKQIAKLKKSMLRKVRIKA